MKKYILRHAFCCIQIKFEIVGLKNFLSTCIQYGYKEADLTMV